MVKWNRHEEVFISVGDFQSWRFRGQKVTEHEVPEGDAQKVVIRITGRPLTFPTSDQ